MAERVGFEPTVPLQVHLISNQARSTGLRHLSEGAEASRIPGISATRSDGLVLAGQLGLIRRPGTLVLACAHLEGGARGVRHDRRIRKRVLDEEITRRRSGTDEDVRTRSNVGRIDPIWREMT